MIILSTAARCSSATARPSKDWRSKVRTEPERTGLDNPVNPC
nr:MAG TPA: hypothetical protein [Caudoviricetes sp.]